MLAWCINSSSELLRRVEPVEARLSRRRLSRRGDTWLFCRKKPITDGMLDACFEVPAIFKRRLVIAFYFRLISLFSFINYKQAHPSRIKWMVFFLIFRKGLGWHFKIWFRKICVNESLQSNAFISGFSFKTSQPGACTHEAMYVYLWECHVTMHVRMTLDNRIGDRKCLILSYNAAVSLSCKLFQTFYALLLNPLLSNKLLKSWMRAFLSEGRN